jgi:hypothetical protein
MTMSLDNIEGEIERATSLPIPTIDDITALVAQRKGPLPVVDNYFGGCPVCGKSDGCLNVYKTHFFICTEHRTRWIIGSNIFSDWLDEDEAIWRKNSALLTLYVEVEPVANYRDVNPEVFFAARCRDHGYSLSTLPAEALTFLAESASRLGWIATM